MAELLLRDAMLVVEDGIRPGGVLIKGGRIAGIFPQDEMPTGLESLDLGGSYLAPGLVDIHIHGSAGVDLLEADPSGLAKLSQHLLAEGVTGYFAALVPTDEHGYRSALAEIRAHIERQDEQSGQARILGVHFEGPFVNRNRCGALRPEYFSEYDGDARQLDLFVGFGKVATVLMTLAPEIAGGIQLVRDLVDRGVRVFIGHSQADPETLDIAHRLGARHMTHFPNALDPLHHRNPGAVAWGLVRGDVTLDCIADFQHVHPLMLKLIYQSKGPDHMALISDAMLAAGMGDGQFTVWGHGVTVRGGKATLSNGTLVGSVISLRRAVKNMIELGVPLQEAIKMAALVPARAAGVDLTCGSMRKGKRADLIAFDYQLDMKLAVVGGKLTRFD
jgi:N-acetylglucosamine-6-phosphate deacetylase